MTVRVSFPALLSDRIDGVGAVEFDGETIDAVLRTLTRRHPPLASLVWQEDHSLNPVLVVFLNDQQVPGDRLDTPVAAGDELTLVPAVEGGSGAGAVRLRRAGGAWYGRAAVPGGVVAPMASNPARSDQSGDAARRAPRNIRTPDAGPPNRFAPVQPYRQNRQHRERRAGEAERGVAPAGDQHAR